MPDLEDKEGETALHKAALHGHLSIIVYLLQNKADVHARDTDGWTALHNACSQVRSLIAIPVVMLLKDENIGLSRYSPMAL